MNKALAEQYKGVLSIARDYWSSYGGCRALLSSPYLHASLLLSMAAYGLSATHRWAELSLSTLPNVLGFSVGGYAILMSFGGEKFLGTLAKVRSGEVAVLKGVSAAFVHFVLVQTLTLGWALIANAADAGPLLYLASWSTTSFAVSGKILRIVFHWFGGFLLWYSLLCGVAATMGIFRLARMFVSFSSSARD